MIFLFSNDISSHVSSGDMSGTETQLTGQWTSTQGTGVVKTKKGRCVSRTMHRTATQGPIEQDIHSQTLTSGKQPCVFWSQFVQLVRPRRNSGTFLFYFSVASFFQTKGDNFKQFGQRENKTEVIVNQKDLIVIAERNPVQNSQHVS